ncbi:MAG: thiol peroxidase [Candidatus Omnitrophica bacterium]|nr:thiol peroxidase [Candidatus Omnitrophota bacterium]
MSRTILHKGRPVTLVGRLLRLQDIAPDFHVASQDLSDISLADLKGKIKILTSFPSIDTPVCDLQIKEFNKRACGLNQDVLILGISKDLPFAQRRFCDFFEVKNVRLLSDYKTSSFGINYGILIKELNLLARSVIIVDKNNRIRYIQITGELSAPPDYGEALNMLEDVIRNPAWGEKEEALPRCKPCEIGALPLPEDKARAMLSERSAAWQMVDGKKITREFLFRDFSEAKYFLDLISVLAEEQGHHPGFVLAYNKLKVTLTTHAAGGLTENDFIMAGYIDRLSSD